jgi:hypothetical protein
MTARILLLVVSAIVLAGCQTGPEPSYPQNPTDSGSRYNNFTLPSSRMGMQDTDLED